MAVSPVCSGKSVCTGVGATGTYLTARTSSNCQCRARQTCVIRSDVVDLPHQDGEQCGLAVHDVDVRPSARRGCVVPGRIVRCRFVIVLCTRPKSSTLIRYSRRWSRSTSNP